MGDGYRRVDDADEQEDVTLLKITRQCGTESNELTLLLEGRLAGQWVEELKAYCRELSTNQQQCTVVDLTGVTFIDADGKTLLTTLWQQGATLRASGCLTRCVVEEITGTNNITH